jgi:hypothetical protein
VRVCFAVLAAPGGVAIASSGHRRRLNQTTERSGAMR